MEEYPHTVHDHIGLEKENTPKIYDEKYCTRIWLCQPGLPFGRRITHRIPQVHFKTLINPLGLPISLRVVGRAESKINSQ